MNIIVFIIAGLCAQVSSQYGCFLNYTEQTLEISIPEKISYGQTLLTTLTTNNITIGAAEHHIIPFFVELYTASLGEGLYNITLVTNTNVTEIDDNETLCKVSRVWGLNLICWNTKSIALIIKFDVKYTDDADPVLNISPSFQIPELSSVNTTIVNLNNIVDFYTDKDCAVLTQANYYLQEGNTDEAFRLSNGVISVNRLISYQKGEIEFELILLVTTSHDFDFDSVRTGSTKVVINITDVDDNDPVFDNPVYTIHVQEENTTVLNVPHLTSPPVFAFDQDTGINDRVTYSINGTNNTVGIGNETGLVWVTRVLDREAEPFVNLTIKANQVHNSWRSAVATIMVVVDDINDNRPKFESDNPNLVRIPEHCAAGLSVVRVLALDADTGENALFNYTLDPPQSSFTIQTANVEKPRYGVVIVTNSSALDRETISTLNITLGTVEYTPTQGGDCTTGMCNMTITIELIDINDNSPVFENPIYSMTVTDITIGAFVQMINASDADEGENADLVYKCVSYSSLWADACGVVSVNNKTGEIRLSHSLSSLQMYYALIEACDSPSDLSQRRCTTVPVTVALDLEVDVTSYNFTVHENLPPKTHVGDLLIYNRRFMLQHDEFELEEGTLHTTKPLDRETDDEFMLIINTNNQNNTNISVMVTVLDVNDNSPVFSNSSYLLIVMDNSVDAFIETINASDEDEGENADLHYKCMSFHSPDSDGCSVIVVNNTTGDVRLQRSLVTSQTYFALVEACDSPADISQSRCTTVPVIISLHPDLELNVTSYNFSVYENLLEGTHVGDILTYNDRYTFQHDKFELNERTLRTTKSLDREIHDQFMLVINTNNQNNTNISVLVTVLDVNDNSPVFNNSSYLLIVKDNSVDAFLETINASDEDEGENADLHYKCLSFHSPDSDGCSVIVVNNTTGDVRLQRSLVTSQTYFALVEACDSPADISQSRCTTVPVTISLPPDLELNVTSYNFTVQENLPKWTLVGDILSYNDLYMFQDDNFKLNERTLRTATLLDREERNEYILVINTNNKNNTNISVLVTVLDVNDNSPVFNNTNYILAVIDNRKDTFVETINASDADEGENAALRYGCVSSVTSNDACHVMKVNDTTGDIRLTQPLISSHTYYALIEACDSPTDISQRRCTTVPVGIHLPSTVNATSYNFTVHENLPPGTYVGDLLNHDSHFVLQHDKFQLNEGYRRANHQGHNQDRGIYFEEPLDREKEDRHLLVINTNNQNNTNIFILVIVLDVNDNNPVFKPNNGSVTLSGGETTGHVITVVNASDDDEGDNAKITYSLQPDSMLQYFYINNSGKIILQTLSTLETMDLLVKASDGGSPSLSGFFTLKITIPAVNGSVVIFAPVTSDKVAGKKKSVEGELMLILGVNVTIEAIRQHSPDSSAIYITARGTSTGHPLKMEELQKLVDSKPAEIADLFRQTVPDGTSEKSTAADDFNTPVIVLIVIAAVFLIALIIATVIIARVYKRKRNKRLFKRLSTSSTVCNSASEDGNKQDEINEAINPDFVEEEEESQNVTLINETEVTSEADMQPCHNVDNDDDVSENQATERPPDADSGVPSDPQNGPGDDDIHNSSDDGSSSPQTPRSSSYPAAVLDEPLLNSADPGHEVVDVMSPETFSGALEAILLPVDSLESGPPVEPPVDFEVQDNYLEEEVPKEVTEEDLPIAEAEVRSDLDPVTPDDDIEETRFLGFRVPTRSFTPPMVRKSQEQREEELEPMPEEPLPDYGKRVRFNFQVTEHEITDYNDNDEDLENDDSDADDPADDEENFPTLPPPLPPAPTSSTDDNSDDLRRSDEHDPDTNEEEEITSF